ncbi:MAG: M28 family peptidase [Synergistaceae bacterium]|nr:M28 family peptidase [Synergistaceae bacterium]
MLSEQEKRYLSYLDVEKLHVYFKNIASFHRRSDGKGEGDARAYIREELDRLGIAVSESASKGLLAFGGAGRVEVLSPDPREIPAKAWNFSAPALAVSGAAVVLERADFPAGVLDHLSGERGTKRDLEGRVALSRFVSPQAVLNAQSRGAVGFVICWDTGGEKQIHHSGVAMWWGTPMPEESLWSPAIPVLAVNRDDGNLLIDRAKQGRTVLSLSCESVETVADVPLLEAFLPSTTDDPHFLLVGAHLDSKHFGATDNATGAAIALSLAAALGALPERRWGVRICWWSGHEFGKYTGSSNYVRDRFEEMDRHCVAYSNIDMPGMRGASDFGKITAGPDLFALAERTVADLTGQKGTASPRVRSWDQSFQNLGISPFFIWTSALPPDSPDRTGSGAMPWWWHTEADTAEFCDPQTLETDARLYMTGLLRLLAEGGLDVVSLGNAVAGRLRELEAVLPESIDPKPLREALQKAVGRWDANARRFETTLRAARLLNRVHYAARDAYLQDWGDVGDFVPGLSEAARILQRDGLSERQKVIVHNYAKTQWNRLNLLVRELAGLTREKFKI